MSRHNELIAGPFALDFLDDVLAKAREDGAHSVHFSMAEAANIDECQKIKVTLVDSNQRTIPRLYYIIDVKLTGSQPIFKGTLSRVVTTTILGGG